jgi:ankyrin repeat protein
MNFFRARSHLRMASDRDASVVFLQRILMNLSVTNFEQSRDLLLRSRWADNPELVPSLIHNIILTTVYRPYTCRLTARLVATLNETVPPEFNFKVRLMTEIFNRFASRAYTPLRGAMCNFLLYSVLENISSPTELVALATTFEPRVEQFEVIAFNLFVWLAPELQRSTPDFFQRCEFLLDKLRVTEGLYPTVQRFLSDLPRLRENDWFQLKQRRLSDRTLVIFSAIFKRNDIENLLRLSVHPAFNIDQKIALSIFEPSFFVSNSPSMIEFAGFCGAIDCFQFFLEHGADIGVTDSNSVALGDFVAAGGFDDVIEMFDEVTPGFMTQSGHLLAQFHHKNAPISAKSFLAAAISNNLGVVRGCLAAGVDVNWANEKKKTALMIAAQYGHVELVRLLLGVKGVAVNAQDDEQFTALQLGCQNRFSEVVELLLSTEGVDVNRPQRFGMTPLHWAAQKGFLGIVGQLVVAGADLNAKDDESWRPIHWAVQNEHKEIVDALLRQEKIEVNVAQKVPLEIPTDSLRSTWLLFAET